MQSHPHQKSVPVKSHPHQKLVPVQAVPTRSRQGSSQLVPWSRRDCPFLSISAPFNPELTGHGEVLQPHGHLKPPLNPTAFS